MYSDLVCVSKEKPDNIWVDRNEVVAIVPNDQRGWGSIILLDGMPPMSVPLDPQSVLDRLHKRVTVEKAVVHALAPPEGEAS